MRHNVEFLEDWLLDTAKEASEQFDPIPYDFMESEDFALGLEIIMVITAIMSVSFAIGDLSRFL